MMNKDNFELNGDWSYEIELSAFAGFQERRGPYASISSELPTNGVVTIEFEDDLTDNPDPYVEQLNTLDFIINNQEKIVHVITEKTLQNLQDIRRFNAENEKKFQHIKYDNVKSIMGIAAINIKTASKDYFSYYDIVCGCDWSKSAINFLFHYERIVSLKSNGISRWDALKDNGSYERIWNKPHEIKAPQRYTAPLKYNKLKPSQKFENDSYEHSLIARKLNEKFKKEVESGEIDINGKYKLADITFLELTYWFENNELSEYLLSKKATIRYALHNCVDYAYSEEALALLLKHGADINAYNMFGKTIIYRLVSALLYWLDDQYKLNKNAEFEFSHQDPEIFKQKIYHFIKLGANPYIRNHNGINCFDAMQYASPDGQTQVINFLQDCLKEK
ncbi:ankyrin repeat domain-containing protein [Chitinophaga sp. CF118]|uniref:DUF6985 domain-containing protein n=1 Tax=Chitinophaga sp. CF118 TaxID=1884367 RepID=UPI000B7E0DDE|nr:ankyrin repeat domain-containing protein [Chitinophaga sp. CF118]